MGRSLVNGQLSLQELKPSLGAMGTPIHRQPHHYNNQPNNQQYPHHQQPQPVYSPHHHQSPALPQQSPYYQDQHQPSFPQEKQDQSYHDQNHQDQQRQEQVAQDQQQHHEEQAYQQSMPSPSYDNSANSDYYPSGDETPMMTGSDSPVYERAESHRSTPETLVGPSSTAVDPSPPSPETQSQPISVLESKDPQMMSRLEDLKTVIESLLAKKSSSSSNNDESAPDQEEPVLGVSSIKWDDVRDIYESNLPSFTFREGFINKYSCITLCSYTAQLVKCFPGPIFGNYTKQAQLILPIFAIACGPFKDAEMTLNKEYVNPNLKLKGKFDLFIKKGNKRFGVIHAKMGQMEQAMTECILGMEAVADSDKVHNVYGVVTDYIYWFFLERRNDVVRRHISTLALNGDVPLDPSLLSIASTIVSLLSDAR
jgi:hypothetical protein